MACRWPLTDDSISREDMDALIGLLQDRPCLSQAGNVAAFEQEWSQWLGVKHSVFVNSGASASLLTMAAMRYLYGPGQVILPALGWVSDIASVFQNGLEPVFVDLNPRTLCMDEEQVLARLGANTRAVYLAHVQGFHGLSQRLLDGLNERGVPLIEGVRQSHGAEFQGRKAGAFGLAATFSFAQHLSTVEGGMVCTDHPAIHQVVRMLRSHGMLSEASDESLRQVYARENPQLRPEGLFVLPGFNARSTELNALLGRSRLKRLDAENELRRRNFALFLERLDSGLFRTDFDLTGWCGCVLNLVLRPERATPEACQRLERAMLENGVEFRRGGAGGGNQLRQPYLQGIVAEDAWKDVPETEHVHFHGYILGNGPGLEPEDVRELCALLNAAG